jgi:AcrR family transcriptional regulator
MSARELTMVEGPRELPLTDDPCERADAARNRRLITAAAERLFAERGVDGVSMEAIAREAGVGKGTVFRRFGDRAGLLHALLDSHEREFQDRVLRGAPPLGPGAPAVERLAAFGRGLLAQLETHGEILIAAESGPRWVRFNHPVYAFNRAHVTMLVREAAPGLDADYAAEALLAPLSADHYLFLRNSREMPPERIASGYEDLVRRLLGAPAV